MPKKMRWLLTTIVMTGVIGAGYAQAPKADLERSEMIRADMVAYNPHYREMVAPRRKELNALIDEVNRREGEGKVVTCSHQIALETRWLLGYTADFARVDRRLLDLKESLAHPEKEALANQEDPNDGSWGGCFTDWFERLDASYDILEMYKLRGIAPKYRFSLLDRVNSPEKMKAYFASITTSDVAHTGVDHRKEVNAAFVDLLRLLRDGDPVGYPWAPGVKETLMHLTLDKYRNMKTGWWGESYIHQGKRVQVDDLSMTFHIVLALNDNVPLKREMATTLFALKNVDYPVGWVEEGGQNNHNNMDVIVLMHASWNAMTPAQREEGRAEIRRMLHWCLTESLQPDGSFKPSVGGDDSIEEGEHFGVVFLTRIGYFDKSKRFWTNQDFPEAEAHRRRIIAYIKAHQNNGAAGGAYYSSALQELIH